MIGPSRAHLTLLALGVHAEAPHTTGVLAITDIRAFRAREHHAVIRNAVDVHGVIGRGARFECCACYWRGGDEERKG